MRFGLAVAAALLFGAPAARAQAETYRIAGVVVHAATGRPAPRIRVAIAPYAARDRETVAVTGDDGRFQFEGLPAGKYSLTADHPTGGRQVYGETDAGPGFGTGIVAGPQLDTGNLVFRIYGPSAIHGRVADPGGDPIEGVLVQIFRSAVVRGRRDVFFYRSMRTDDLGEYRFGQAPPGTYYVLATGRPWYTANAGALQADSPIALTTYLPTFYPNAREGRAATPLRVKAGDDVAADMVLDTMPAGKLTVNIDAGEVAVVAPQAPKGVPMRMPRNIGPPVRVDVTFEGPGGSAAWERVENAAGIAVLNGIPQGRYTVRVSASDPANPLYGRQDVTVGAGETTVQIALEKPPAVSGTLRMEGGDPAIPRGTVIELENEVEGRHIRRPVGADGTFSFESLPPAQYTPLLMSPTSTIRLRSVKVNGQGVPGWWVDVTRSLRLDLTAVAKAGEVSGLVYRSGTAQPGAMVVLAPRPESSNPYDYRAYQSDSDGSFDFTGVTAGEYTIFALDYQADFEYANPEAVRPYLASGEPLRVGPNQAQTVRVEMRP